MKIKLLLGGAILASSFALNSVTALAIAPNSTTAIACLDICNIGTTGTSISGGGFSSDASVSGFTLHSYSEYRPAMQIPDLNLQTEIIEIPREYFGTSGHASINQNFVALNDGVGGVQFNWDGSLFSEGNGLFAGYSFSGSVFQNGNLVDSFFRSGENPGIGTDSVDKTLGINIEFNQGDTISVSATLSTYVNKFREIIICNFDQACQIPTISRLLDVNDVYQIGGPAAFADFSNTGSFSITGNGLQAVPVPAAVWLPGSALLGLVGFSRKKATA